MSPDLAATAGAFSALAPSYDATFGTNPVGLYFRYVVQERLRRAFPKGARVLDLGCGSGDDALYLAGLGVHVLAVDVAPGMIETARAKAAHLGIGASVVRFDVRPAEDLGALEAGSLDGAYSNFGALNCADLGAVGEGLARALRPGAPVVLSVVGPRPLPALVAEALTGRPARPAEVRVEGRVVPARPFAASEVAAGLGPRFTWTGVSALGVLVPSPAHGAWAARNPMVFGALASLEAVVRSWPVLRGLGDHVLMEGRRR